MAPFYECDTPPFMDLAEVACAMGRGTHDMSMINTRIMSDSMPTQNSDAFYMSSILVSRILRALQPTRSCLRWSDDLHKIFVEAVAYQGGPCEAKPTAVKQTMEAMGVRGLTTRNIKSHLQKYREKCDLGAEPPSDMLGAASPISKAALKLVMCRTSETVMGHEAAMTEIEVVNNLLMDDIEMVETNFSVDEVQTMEKELMNEIQLIKNDPQHFQTPLDDYTDDLTNYTFDHTVSANSFSL